MRRMMSCTRPARDHRDREEGKLHCCAISEDDDVRLIIDEVTCSVQHLPRITSRSGRHLPF